MLTSKQVINNTARHGHVRSISPVGHDQPDDCNYAASVTLAEHESDVRRSNAERQMTAGGRLCPLWLVVSML